VDKSAIAKKCKINYYLIMKQGRPRNLAQRIAVKDLFKKGYSYKDISEMLKMSRQLAYYYAVKAVKNGVK